MTPLSTSGVCPLKTVSADARNDLMGPVGSYMDEVGQLKLPAPDYDVERMDRALTAYTNLGRDAAISAMRSSRNGDFNPVVVSAVQSISSDST